MSVALIAAALGMFMMNVHGNRQMTEEVTCSGQQPINTNRLQHQQQSVGSPWPMPQTLITTPDIYTLEDQKSFRFV